MPTALRSLDGWVCKLVGDGIAVSTANKQHGSYRLLRNPYCTRCALPGVSTGKCPWHHEDTLSRTYAMGPYLPVGNPNAKTDRLSQHILGLKLYQGYAIPLGMGMSICLENVYPELAKTDIICPVPKHPSEFKIDKETDERYNQSFELAKVLSSELSMNLEEAVVKTRPYSQKAADWKSRVNIPPDVYIFNAKVDVKKRSVLLIDDVRTSGGTLSSCSNALLSNGAKTVNGYVAGRDAGKDWVP